MISQYGAAGAARNDQEDLMNLYNTFQNGFDLGGGNGNEPITLSLENSEETEPAEVIRGKKA